MAPPAALISDLVRAYPRTPISPDTLRVYLDDLGEIPHALLEQAIRQVIRTQEFFPTIRSIREACAEIALDLPTDTEALQLVDDHLLQAREGTVVWKMPPLVEEAVKLAGGYRAFRTSDEPTVVRGQFARYFRDLRAARIRAAQTSDTVVPARALSAA